MTFLAILVLAGIVYYFYDAGRSDGYRAGYNSGHADASNGYENTSYDDNENHNYNNEVSIFGASIDY